MAVILGGILECRPFSGKRAPSGGQNFLSQKVGGRISVWVCSSSSNNDGSVHLYSKNVGKKQTRREDLLLPSYIDKGSTMRWWLPLFGWSDQERWVDDESKTESMDKSSDDVEKEMGEAPIKHSKSVKGRFTPEKDLGKRQTRREDLLLPSYIDKGSTMRWWLPLFGWSDQERWVDDESKTKSMDKSSDDAEKEMGEAPVKPSKFVWGSLTREKAKLLTG